MAMSAAHGVTRPAWSRNLFVASLVIGLLGLVARGLAADTITLRLGTLAPRGSSFYKSLQMMGENWRKVSDGTVRLIIYPDGVQGGEADMVRKMRVDKLNAGLLTAVGLAEIEPAVTALQSMPMVFRTLDEVDYVAEKLRPELERRLRGKGFVVLFWGDAGWVRYFSKTPVVRPDDLRPLKLFVWQGDATLVDLWRSAGYRPVPLETADIIQGLRTGLIEVTPAPPVFAVASQIFDAAPHMLELNWAPLVGACVVNAGAWDKIPANQQAEFLQAAEQAGKEIKANNRKESDEAVRAMEKRGLKVHPVTPEIAADWRKAVEPFYPKIRGTLVPAEMFDEVLKILEDSRRAGGARP
jgi:TRAP-type C4-dicarboxylate transport system substrate-binding protein